MTANQNLHRELWRSMLPHEIADALVDRLEERRGLENKNRQLRTLLQQMLDVAENGDEAGYIEDVGFVNLDKLHAAVRIAISAENNKLSNSGHQPTP